jgi:hypothetical protein
METGWMRKSLCLACLSLSMVLTAVGAGQTAVGAGQSGTPSIVNRVQREDDPELKELIGIALTNRKSVSEYERRFEIVRKVTQSYAQIKLLDQQIDQIGRKMELTSGPAEMRYELLLAKAELEAKRTTELASLREVMGVIPKLPFESQPVPTLNAWVTLKVIGERVLVLDAIKGFSNYWAMERHKVTGLLSEKETLDYLGGRLKDKDSLPIRIDIYYQPETDNASARLRDAVFSLAREAKTEMRTEVRLTLANFVGSGESAFYLRAGKIRTLYPDAVQRPDGGAKLLTTGVVDPNDLEQSILWRLTTPKNVPLRFRIEYDEASAKLAKQVADTAKSVAKRVGIAELVEVTGALVEPVPETTFLCRWEAIMQGEIQTLDVQPGGICQATMGKGSQVIPAGANIRGTWLPTTNEIIVDIKDKDKNFYVYRGSVNAEGNLVIDRGVIFPQGSFHLSGPARTILKKVY